MIFTSRTNKSPLTYNKWFWAAFLSTGIACCIAALYLLPQTFPFVSLTITMDREQAEKKAREIATEHNLGPVGSESAALFSTDSYGICFIERTGGGGNSALLNIMEKNLYMPYSWAIRHYKEYEKREVTIRFKPDGTVYGFTETLSENDPGAQLSQKEAQNIAETNASLYWNVNFENYTRIEAAKKLQPSNRLDHSFVYERTDERIGEEGFYRLALTVSGDKLTHVNHFIKIPESFTRQYENMRSANNTIAFIATIILIILYVLGGCGFGLYYLNKRRALILKPARFLGLLIGAMLGLMSITMLPTSWMRYYTALSYKAFLTQLMTGAFMNFIFQGIILTIIIAVAEGLTRLARPHQPQLWQLWSPANAASYQIIGRTVAGYALVMFQFAYVIFFYFFSARYLNWWMPSDLLINPNVLSAYLPWLSPLAQSVYAGTMEECLFRAIPLAGATLLGNHFGKKGWWVAAAFILQAVVFGAAHANYPTQPAYTRIIELLFPSFVWGIMYLRFGLLTTIISHTVYDVIWFAMPLFVSHTSSALLSKLLVVIGSSIPLLALAYGLFRHKTITTLPQSALNNAWIAPEIETPPTEQHQEEETAPSSSRILSVLLLVVSSIVWFGAMQFSHQGIHLKTTKAQAKECAADYLKNKNITLPSEQWNAYTLFFDHYNQVPALAQQHAFIWRNYDHATYHQLLGTYLEAPHWTTRYVQFEGDLINRAEEYKVVCNEIDNSVQLYHTLPESAEKKSLSKDDARSYALEAVRTSLGTDTTTLKEIKAQDFQLPKRKNWLFTFEDQTVVLGNNSSARIDVVVSGDEVNHISRYIHVPEEWIRNQHNEQSQRGLLLWFVWFIFTACALFVLRSAPRYIHATVSQSNRYFYGTLVLLCAVKLINFFITIPAALGTFNTVEPYTNQLFRMIIMSVLQIVVSSAIMAYFVQWTVATARRMQVASGNTLSDVVQGVGIGMTYTAFLAIAQKISSAYFPVWPHYAPLQSSNSLLFTVIEYALRYVNFTTSTFIASLCMSTRYYTVKNNRLLLLVLYFSAGLLRFGISSLTLSSIILWLVGGAAGGLFFAGAQQYVVHYNPAIIPVAVGTYVITNIIQKFCFNAYAGAQLDALVAACVVMVMTVFCYKKLIRKHE